MSHLFPNYARWPLAIVRGEGNYVWDEQGNKYLDFVSGIAVTSLGHAPAAVKEKLKQQLDQLWHSSNLFQHPLQEQLADKLAEISGLDRVLFCNSGAEANEAAIKLARRYAQKVLNQDRYEIITFTGSFHGRTLATLTATGQEKVKDGFAPLPEGFVTVPFQDIEALREAISSKTCAVMLELVQGEGGVNPADPEWVAQVAELCREHDLLLMIDEVQTGIGRTGSWFAFQQYGIEPDVVTVAKGLGSGFPVGAILAKEKTNEAFGPGSHGTTFGGNPLAMAAGLGTLEEIETHNLLSRVQELGDYFKEHLNRLVAQSSLVKSVRGKGLLLGLQLTIPVQEVLETTREKGVLFLPAGPDVLRILPPFTTNRSEIQHAVDVLSDVLEELEDKQKQHHSA
ncbi:MAG: acetylornithine transaminase [Bacillaceae bacterium]|nr:acetylornithine transaminase [Bacillaceae bacterium]